MKLKKKRLLFPILDLDTMNHEGNFTKFSTLLVNY